MHILFINYTFPLPENGGSERTIDKLSNHFISQNIIVSVAFFEGTYSDKGIYHSVLDLSKRNNSPELLKEYLYTHKISIILLFVKFCDQRILKIIKDSDVKLISALRFAPDDSIKKLLVKLNRSNKLSMKTFLLYPLQNIYLFYISHLSRKKIRSVYDYSAKYVLASFSLIPDFVKINKIKDTEKIAVIGNALSFKIETTERDILSKKNVVLIVARMVEKSKRILLALEIWKRLNNKYDLHDWELHLVGDGEDLNSYRMFVARNMLHNVKIFGRQEPLGFYKYSSLFLMTSATEGLGNTIIEAQQLGCVPICFSSFKALHDIVDHNFNGIIIPEGEIDKYIDAIMFLMKNKQERLRLAKNGVISVRKYDISMIGSEWLNLFREVVC